MFSISSVERKQYVFHGAIAYGRTVVSFSVKLLPTNSRNLLNFLWDNSQNVADDQHGHTNTALASEKEARKWYIVLLIRSTGCTRSLSSLDQSIENALTPSVSEHKYMELNLFDLRFLSETNSCNFSLLIPLLTIKLLSKLSVYQKTFFEDFRE